MWPKAEDVAPLHTDTRRGPEPALQGPLGPRTLSSTPETTVCISVLRGSDFDQFLPNWKCCFLLLSGRCETHTSQAPLCPGCDQKRYLHKPLNKTEPLSPGPGVTSFPGGFLPPGPALDTVRPVSPHPSAALQDGLCRNHPHLTDGEARDMPGTWPAHGHKAGNGRARAGTKASVQSPCFSLPLMGLSAKEAYTALPACPSATRRERPARLHGPRWPSLRPLMLLPLTVNLDADLLLFSLQNPLISAQTRMSFS